MKEDVRMIGGWHDMVELASTRTIKKKKSKVIQFQQILTNISNYSIKKSILELFMWVPTHPHSNLIYLLNILYSNKKNN
jgi:hypothetical protein